LPVPERAVAGVADRCLGKGRVGGLQLLQADDVGGRLGQPFEQPRQPAVDAIDVERGDLHCDLVALHYGAGGGPMLSCLTVAAPLRDIQPLRWSPPCPPCCPTSTPMACSSI